jgi:hypothetical protein
MSVTRVQLVGNVSGGAVFSGNVGIGTTNPTSKLHIVGNTLVTGVSTATSIVVGSGGAAATPSLTFTDDLNTGIFSPSADTIAFSEGGVERARIDSAGRILVGTEATSRSVLLATNDSVVSNAGIEIFRAVPTSNPLNAGLVITVNPANNDGQSCLVLAKTNGNANGSFTAVQTGTLGSVVFAGSDGSSLRPAAQITGVGGTPNSGIPPGSLPGQLTFSTTDVGGTTPTERMRIDSSGRLLVGTSSARESRGGNVAFQTQVQLESNDTQTGLAVSRFNDAYNSSFVSLQKGRGTIASPAAVIANDATGTIVFSGWDGAAFTNSALIRSEVDGAVGINSMPGRLVFSTTADGASTPTERMRIDSTGNIIVENISTTGNGYFKVPVANATKGAWVSLTSATGLRKHLRFENGNGEVGSISTNASATAYTTSSDYRLKENVVALDGAIDRLNQLPVHRFNFIADPDTVVDGFIAHEAAAVVPECVTGEKDAVDDDGNPVYQGIDQSKLVPLLTAALQEAVAKIESLEARLTAAGL